jgi:hypothetical protein
MGKWMNNIESQIEVGDQIIFSGMHLHGLALAGRTATLIHIVAPGEKIPQEWHLWNASLDLSKTRKFVFKMDDSEEHLVATSGDGIWGVVEFHPSREQILDRPTDE